MRAIWKFPIKIASAFVVDMPRDFLVLHVGIQGTPGFESPAFWAEVDTDSPTVMVRFGVVTTGAALDQALNRTDTEHLGTFLLDHGSFVGHLYGPRSGGEG